jgi:hypothetical protein
VAARVDGQNGIPARHEVRLGRRVQASSRLPESHDRRPACARAEAVGDVERRGEVDTVAHPQPEILFGERVGRRRQDERQSEDGEHATHC